MKYGYNVSSTTPALPLLALSCHLGSLPIVHGLPFWVLAYNFDYIGWFVFVYPSGCSQSSALPF
jgi:hypothetical protein